MDSIVEISKRKKLENLDVSQLNLDSYNPRLPEEIQGKSERQVLQVLFRDFDLGELADSLSHNGYFDEEPLIAVPIDLPKRLDGVKPSDKEWSEFLDFIRKPSTEFIVVEGNRRLAAIKILLDSTLRGELKIKEWPKVSPIVKEDLEKLPVIVYVKREDIVPYLGIRHIKGVKRWEPFAKARYVLDMNSKGYSLGQISEMIGDKTGEVRKMYIAYKLVEILEEESEGSTENAKNNFSYLLLALQQKPIREFIGLPSPLNRVDLKNPIPKDKIKNLGSLFLWFFGKGKEILPIFGDSRMITQKIVPILKSKEATIILIETKDLEEAYDMSDGKIEAIKKKLRTIIRNLRYVYGFVHECSDKEVVNLLEESEEMLDLVFKSIKIKKNKEKEENV